MKETSQQEDSNLWLIVTELLVCSLQDFPLKPNLIVLSLELLIKNNKIFGIHACLLLILGFIKFLGPYYMLLITKRRKIGAICGHSIYAITKSEMIPIPNSTVRSNMAYSKNENRSFVHSACKCKMSFVLLQRPKSLAFRIPHCPYVLDENFVLVGLFYLNFNSISLDKWCDFWCLHLIVDKFLLLWLHPYLLQIGHTFLIVCLLLTVNKFLSKENIKCYFPTTSSVPFIS